MERQVLFGHLSVSESQLARLFALTSLSPTRDKDVFLY